MPSTKAFVGASLLLICSQVAYGSIGDRSLAYQQCTGACRTSCEDGTHTPLALIMKVTLWSCEDDCAYSCMHNLTNSAISPNLSVAEKLRSLPGLPPNRVVQYHGKWPFYRFLGIQEPLSVLFSAGNLYMHVKYGLSLRKKLPPDLPKPLVSALKYLPLAGINLWIWSMVFHTRDKPTTEKLDYFSAALAMLCNLYYAIIRLGALYQDHTHHPALRRAVFWSLSTLFLCHISYLSFWRFDYSYNMLFNVSIGLLHNLLWLGWTLYQATLPRGKGSDRRTLSAPSNALTKQRAPHYLRPTLVLTLLSSLLALELLDFPPILRSLDAHALWHAATIPVIKWWYECLVIDAWWLTGHRNPAKHDKTLT